MIMKQSYLCVIFLLAAVLSCKKDPMTGDDTDKQALNTTYQWTDATVTLPTGTSYSLNGHEMIAVGSAVKVEHDGRTKVPKREKAVSIYAVMNAAGDPVLLGYSTPEKTDISPEATAKVVLYNLYRMATMPLEMQVGFFEEFESNAEAQAFVSAFVEHWKTDPTALATKSYLSIVREYHGSSKNTYRELSAAAKDKVMGGEGRYYFVESADSGKAYAGYTMRIEDGNKFYLVNKGPGRATAFVYKTKRKGNTDSQFTDLLTTYGPDTRADQTWFVNSAEYVPERNYLTMAVRDYRNAGFDGAIKFKETTSGPHQLVLGDDDVEAQYAIRIIDAGLGVRPSELTRAECRAYEKHVHASLIIDYYLPFLGTYMGLDIQDFYAMDGEECVDRLDEAIRSVGLHTEFASDLAQGQLGRLLLTLESYFQSEETEYGWALHEAVFDALGKDFRWVSKGQAIRLAKLSYYFDNGIFWDAEDERVRFLQYYLDTHGLITLEATARAGIVKVTPRFPRITSLAPNNRVELEASIESEEFKDLNVTYHWHTAGKYGIVAGEQNKAVYVAKENTTEYGDVFESVYAEVRKDGELVGRDSATVHISRSRYQMLPEHATLTGNPSDGANVVTMRIKPKSPDGLDLDNDPAYDFRVEWETEGKYGGIRWAGQYATYWTTESETYNDGSMQYYCQDDQVKSATEIIKATIYAKPKGAPDHFYEFYDFLLGGVDIRNGESQCDVQKEYFVAFEQHDGFSGPITDPHTERTTYNVGPPYVSARITQKSCDGIYQIRSLSKSGAKGEWRNYSVRDLRTNEDGVLEYRVILGQANFSMGVSLEKAMEHLERNNRILANYNGLGVDVRVRQ